MHLRAAVAYRGLPNYVCQKFTHPGDSLEPRVDLDSKVMTESVRALNFAVTPGMTRIRVGIGGRGRYRPIADTRDAPSGTFRQRLSSAAAEGSPLERKVRPRSSV